MSYYLPLFICTDCGKERTRVDRGRLEGGDDRELGPIKRERGCVSVCVCLRMCDIPRYRWNDR